MPRAIWTGAVSFGLVNVPVGLYSATEDHDVHFHQFEKGTTARIRNQRVNEKTGDEVPYEDIVKGAEVGDGNYVMLTQEELESVEPGKSRTIEINDFVEAAEIDPIYYQRSYYLAPSDKSAVKPYVLLARAMAKAERIGVATFVMRGKQYLAAIRPRDDLLILETMYFADEVRDWSKGIDQLPAKARVASKDLTMAVHLVEALTTRWDPKNYRDTYTARVKKLIDAKEKDREIAVPESTEETEGKVLDLLAALESSVQAAKKHKPGNTGDVPRLRTQKAEPSTGKKAAKKSTAKKAATTKSTATKSTAKKSATTKSTAKKSTAKKAATKKSTAKKAATKKAASKKAASKKATSTRSTGKKSASRRAS
jgi:DNA end-binding protein Ku